MHIVHNRNAIKHTTATVYKYQYTFQAIAHLLQTFAYNAVTKVHHYDGR